MISVVKKTVLTFFIIFILSCTEKTPSVVALSGETMGTYWKAIIVADIPQVQQSILKKSVQNILDDIDNKMSTYKKDSEISKFNKDKTKNPFSFSTETYFVIKTSLDLYRKTRGYFDITIGPLLKISGFGANAEAPLKYNEKKVKATLKNIGSDKLILSPNGLTKKNTNIEIDLSAVAKGHGVDRAADFIKKRFKNFLIEIGGEVKVFGNIGNRPWRLAIEGPSILLGSDIAKVIHLSGQNSVATSGSYRQFVKSSGKKKSHIMDPLMGRAVDHNLVSVSVIHPSCMIADALSTALMAMGTDKAIAWANKNELAVFFQYVDDKGEVIKRGSKEFSKRFF